MYDNYIGAFVMWFFLLVAAFAAAALIAWGLGAGIVALVEAVAR